MPVLRDYTIITGADGSFGAEFTLGAGDTENIERRALRLSFNTGGRRASGGALLMFSVKGLTRTTEHPEVLLNGQRIGEIGNYTPVADPEFPGNSRYWYSQTIAFDAGILQAGSGRPNTLEIRTAGTHWPSQEGVREDFTIKSIVCFFPQRSDSDTTWLEDVANGIGTVITWVVDAVTTVANFFVVLADSTVGWLIDLLAFFVELTFSIPIIGRLIKWLWNLGLTGFWAVAPLGLLDFAAALIGIVPEKKMRVCTIILRDEMGDALDTRANLVPQLQNVIDIYRREANVRVISVEPFQFDSGFAGPEEATEDWVHVQSRGRNDAGILDVPCNDGAARNDLGRVGAQFELLASTTCFHSNGRRVIGYGAPIIVFIVRTVGSGKNGCSLGPLSDYVTVEAGRGPNSTVIAHEIGHACNLWHVDDTSNLMARGRVANHLTRFQVAMVRASRHVTYS